MRGEEARSDGGSPVHCWLCATPLIPSARAPTEPQHESHFADEETGHLLSPPHGALVRTMTITNTIIIFIECLLSTAMMLMIPWSSLDL